MISPQCCLLYPALVQGPKNDHIPALLICSFLQFLSLGTWHLLEALFGGSTCLLSSPYMCECTLSRFSHVRVCETPWTVANQVPLSKGFSRQEYWSGLPFPSRLLTAAWSKTSCTSCESGQHTGDNSLNHVVWVHGVPGPLFPLDFLVRWYIPSSFEA